jgi:hypothetical protein
MQKFRDVLSRWEAGELSMMEAGELLGMSERQFRRYRDRYEEDGLAGLVDRRLGKPSLKRVPAASAELMLELNHVSARASATSSPDRAWSRPISRCSTRLKTHSTPARDATMLWTSSIRVGLAT